MLSVSGKLQGVRVGTEGSGLQFGLLFSLCGSPEDGPVLSGVTCPLLCGEGTLSKEIIRGADSGGVEEGWKAPRG